MAKKIIWTVTIDVQIKAPPFFSKGGGLISHLKIDLNGKKLLAD